MCLPALLRWLLWSSSTKTCPPKHRLRQSWPGRLLLFSDYNITLVIYWQNSQRTFSNSSMNQVNRNLTRNYLNSRIVGIHFGVFIKIVEFLEIEYITVYFTFKVILSKTSSPPEFLLHSNEQSPPPPLPDLIINLQIN